MTTMMMTMMKLTTATSSLRQASMRGVNPAGVAVFTWIDIIVIIIFVIVIIIIIIIIIVIIVQIIIIIITTFEAGRS